MDNSRLLFYALGIFVCYFYYGVLQERITKGKYFTTEPDAEPEPFKYSLSLVLTTCFINYLFAKVQLLPPSLSSQNKPLFTICTNKICF
jgi:solute carrier family 35 (UDP-galactose transporter), member B1